VGTVTAECIVVWWWLVLMRIPVPRKPCLTPNATRNVHAICKRNAKGMMKNTHIYLLLVNPLLRQDLMRPILWSQSPTLSFAIRLYLSIMFHFYIFDTAVPPSLTTFTSAFVYKIFPFPAFDERSTNVFIMRKSTSTLISWE